jgi:hypothetical protein
MQGDAAEPNPGNECALRGFETAPKLNPFATLVLPFENNRSVKAETGGPGSVIPACL